MVLSFDRICLLCNGFVRLLARRGRLQFARSGSAAGAAIFLISGQDPANPTTVILVDEQRYVESEAIIRSITTLGGAWRLVAVVRIVPRFLRDAVYRLVARNGSAPSAGLNIARSPLPNWGDRFLT